MNALLRLDRIMPFILFGLLGNTLDIFTTVWNLERGFNELNILAELLGFEDFFLFKLFSVFFFSIIFRRKLNMLFFVFLFPYLASIWNIIQGLSMGGLL